MLPLRYVANAIGAQVDWNGKTRVVTVDKDIKLTIDSDKIVKGSEEIKIDSPAIIKDSRTFVPLRAIAEIVGGEVNWEGSTRTVTITR